MADKIKKIKNLSRHVGYTGGCNGGVLRFVTKPTSTVSIVVEEEHIVTNVAVIYNMFTEWLPYLNIDLPNGYEWKYDEGSHTIIIIFSSGISNILKSRDNGTTVYDLSGKQSSLPSKGLNIIGRKKFIVK